MNLLRKPKDLSLRHHITPQTAGWTYIGFDLIHLKAKEEYRYQATDRETLLVWISGRARLSVETKALGEIGGRESVFDAKKPWSVYIPADAGWRVEATSPLVLGVCTCPSTKKKHPLRVIKPDEVARETRGRNANVRHVHPIMMEDKDYAEHLLVTEVLTPSGNWSSYPSHRHDEDDFPRITQLEEVYYHRFSPSSGFGFQRVYTDKNEAGIRRLDESYALNDEDVVLVPYGYHPCTAAYGYDMYYLNIMAGPKRVWRFQNDPDHDWIAQRDA